MTSREIVIKTFEFKNPERLALDLPTLGITDFYWLPILPQKNWQPSVEGEDEWGSIWKKAGEFDGGYGRLVKPFLETWDNLAKLKPPDLGEYRFDLAKFIVDSKRVEDKFKWGFGGLRLFERMHFLRGLDNLLIDLAEGKKECEILADIVTEYNLKLIEFAGEVGADGIVDCDDWGVQDRLLISPDLWRKFFKPRYAKMIKKAKQYNLKTMLHSCGYIVDIISDLIEIGLDGIDMDQQENMGLKNLSNRFAGKITFQCPVDIQKMGKMEDKEIEEYVRNLIRYLYKDGGLIAKEYGDPDRIGVKREQNIVMGKAFIKLGQFKV